MSCSTGDTQLGGWVLPGSSASVLHGRWPSCGVAEKARIGRDLFPSEDDPAAAKPAPPCSVCPRYDPFARDVALDPGRATAPRIIRDELAARARSLSALMYPIDAGRDLN